MWMAQFCNNNKTFSNFSSDSPIEKGDRRQMMTRQGLCCRHLSPWCFLSFTATPTHTPTGSSYPLKQRAVAMIIHSTVFRATWDMEASYLADIWRTRQKFLRTSVEIHAKKLPGSVLYIEDWITMFLGPWLTPVTSNPFHHHGRHFVCKETNCWTLSSEVISALRPPIFLS